MKKNLLISAIVLSSIVLVFTVISCGKKSGEEGKVYFSTTQSDSNDVINDVREFWISEVQKKGLYGGVKFKNKNTGKISEILEAPDGKTVYQHWSEINPEWPGMNTKIELDQYGFKIIPGKYTFYVHTGTRMDNSTPVLLGSGTFTLK